VADSSRALWVAISVLIVTCPCALSLATPVALTVATGEAARRGFVVTRGHAFEALAGATDIVFDKTGTLTLGRPRLVETLALRDADSHACIALAAALGRLSAHPLDRALVEASAGMLLPAATWVRSEPGEGIEAIVDGGIIRLGRREYVGALHGTAAPVAWIRGTDTVVWLGDARGWIAAFRLGDALRPEAREAIARLKESGATLHLLTGDDPAVAQRVAAELGIARVEARATPERKVAYIRVLQLTGARVAMVGDGVNDAPVLAQADLSVAMGGGADLAQVRADAVLLSDSLGDLARAAHLARRARTVIRQNLAWALAYNLVVVPLAFAGLVTPLLAAVGMSASSLAVVANALRLRGRD
jgi:P-type Cu2+ transporter